MRLEKRSERVMVLAIKVREFKRPPVVPGSRERTLKACAQWRKADEDAKRIAKEHGLEIPELVC